MWMPYLYSINPCNWKVSRFQNHIAKNSLNILYSFSFFAKEVFIIGYIGKGAKPSNSCCCHIRYENRQMASVTVRQGGECRGKDT